MDTRRLRLPRAWRDPAFIRRFVELDQAENQQQRDQILARPLVADRAFTVYTHCARGDLGEHYVADPPVSHDGKPHVARQCIFCDSTWLERMS